MRIATLLIPALVIAVSASFPAQARGFRLRAAHRPVTRIVIVPAIATVAARPVAPAAAQPTSEPGVRAASVRTQAPAAPAVVATEAAAKPWCPTKTLAGAGTGFCLVN